MDAASAWAEDVASSEIAAVAAGRKPVFHEYFGEAAAPALAKAAKFLAKIMPEGVRVEAFDGHLIVVDTAAAGVIAGTADAEAAMGAVRTAAKNDNIGEFLGYGLAHWSDPGAVPVKLFRPDGSLLAGFVSSSDSAEEFAEDRAKDYSDALGIKVVAKVERPDVAPASQNADAGLNSQEELNRGKPASSGGIGSDLAETPPSAPLRPEEGGGINPTHVAKMRDSIRKAMGRLGPSAFPKGYAYTLLGHGGGLAYADGKLLIDLKRLHGTLRHAGAKRIEAAVVEEYIHHLTTTEFRHGEVEALWQRMPDSLKQTVRNAYFAAEIAAGAPIPADVDTPFVLGHEFLRMVIQDKAFAGAITESVNVPKSFVAELIRLLKQLAKRLNGEIAKAPQAVREDIQNYVDRILTRINTLEAGAATMPSRPSGRRGSAVEVGATARNRTVAASDRSSARPVESLDGEGIALGSAGTVHTGTGEPVEFTWAAVEAGRLVVSNHDDGSPNAAYDQSLQGRNRNTAASELNVQDIANNTTFSRLSESGETSGGAPIVGPDLQVESGNGRTMGIRRAYSRKLPNVAGYKADLVASAGRFGLDSEAVAAMDAPVLVRVRRSEVDRAAFAEDANRATVSQMSAREVALQDLANLPDGVFGSLDVSEDGDIYTPANEGFFRRFFQSAVTPGELPALIDANGRLTQQGLDRMRNALFVAAYGSSESGMMAFARMAENPAPEFRNLVKAMMGAAPRFAQVNAMVGAGALPDLSISGDVAAAANAFVELRRRGESVQDYLGQGQLVGDGVTPFQRELLSWIDSGLRSPRKMAETLGNYATLLYRQDNPGQGQLFEAEPASKEQLWEQAKAADGPLDPAGGVLFSASVPDLSSGAFAEPPSQAASVKDGLARRKAVQMADDMLAKLPANARSVVAGVAEGRDFHDIGEEVGLSAEEAEKLYRNATRIVKAKLDREMPDRLALFAGDVSQNARKADTSPGRAKKTGKGMHMPASPDEGRASAEAASKRVRDAVRGTWMESALPGVKFVHGGAAMPGDQFSKKPERYKAEKGGAAWITMADNGRWIDFGPLSNLEAVEGAAREDFQRTADAGSPFQSSARYVNGILAHPDGNRMGNAQFRQAVRMYGNDRAGLIDEMDRQTARLHQEAVEASRKYLTEAYGHDPFFQSAMLRATMHGMGPMDVGAPMALYPTAVASTWAEWNAGRIQSVKALQREYLRHAEAAAEKHLAAQTTAIKGLSGGQWLELPQVPEGASAEESEAIFSMWASMSHANWCTSRGTERAYAKKGPMYVYRKDGDPRMAIRFEGDEVAEIQSERNNGTIPPEYAEEVRHFASKAKLSDQAKKTIERAEREAAILQSIEERRVPGAEWSEDGRLLLRDGTVAQRQVGDESVLVGERTSIVLGDVLIERDAPVLVTVFGNAFLYKGASAPALATVFGNAFLRKGASAPALVTVGGDAFLYEGASAPALVTVGGNVTLHEGASAPALVTVGGNVTLHEGASAPALVTVGGGAFLNEGVSAPALTTVGGNVTLHEGVSAPALVTVGGDAFLYEGASANALTTVGGDAILYEGASANALTTVEGDAILYEGASANALTTVGGDVTLYKGASAPALATVEGNATLRKGASAPALATVFGNAFLYEGASAPALATVEGNAFLYEGVSIPALTTVGGDAILNEGVSAPALTTVGGGAFLNEGVSAPALTTVGGNVTLHEGASVNESLQSSLGRDAALRGTALDESAAPIGAQEARSPSGDAWLMRVTADGQIEVNIDTLPTDPAEIRELLAHEIAHIADRDPQLHKLKHEFLRSLSHRERAAVNKWLSSYPTLSSKSDEAVAEALRMLARNASARPAWERFVARLSKWIKEKLGIALDRKELEAVALSALSRAASQYGAGRRVQARRGSQNAVADAALAQYLEDAGRPFEELPTARQREMLAEAGRQVDAALERLRAEGRIRGGLTTAPDSATTPGIGSNSSASGENIAPGSQADKTVAGRGASSGLHTGEDYSSLEDFEGSGLYSKKYKSAVAREHRLIDSVLGVQMLSVSGKSGSRYFYTPLGKIRVSDHSRYSLGGNTNSAPRITTREGGAALSFILIPPTRDVLERWKEGREVELAILAPLPVRLSVEEMVAMASLTEEGRSAVSLLSSMAGRATKKTDRLAPWHVIRRLSGLEGEADHGVKEVVAALGGKSVDEFRKTQAPVILNRLQARRADYESANKERLRLLKEHNVPLNESPAPESSPGAYTVLAPNGQDSVLHKTLLDEVGDPEEALRLYAMVHTPFFKRWFGDWEGLARSEALRSLGGFVSHVPSLDGLSGKALIDAAKAIHETLQGDHAMPDGRRLKITARGFKEVKHHSSDPRVMHVAANLRTLLDRSVPLWTEENNDPRHSNVRAFHNYGTRATVAGVDSYIRFAVREDNNGQIHYDHDATSVEAVTRNESGKPADPPGRNPSPGEDQAGLAKNRLVQWLASVNPASVSQVRDANGEPLLVWHGTPSGGFDTFKRRPTYFHEDKPESDVYQAPSASSIRAFREEGTPQTYGVFINARATFDTREPSHRDRFEDEFFGQSGEEWAGDTPLSERGLPDWTSGRDIADWIEETGQPYDAVRLDEGGVHQMDGGVRWRGASWMIPNPGGKTVKSATGNRGTFSESGSILFADERPLSPLEADPREKRTFQRWVKNWSSGMIDPRMDIPVGTTPAVLQGLGADPLPLMVAQGVLDKATGGKHGVAREDLPRIADELASPVAVIASRKRADSFVILTEIEEPDGPVIIPVRIDSETGIERSRVNRVTSIYGKNPGALRGMIEEGPILYVNQKKYLDWQRRSGVQFPRRRASSQGSSRILTEANFVNPEDGGEMMFADPRPRSREALFRDAHAQYLEDAGRPFEELPAARQREMLAEAGRQVDAALERLRAEGRVRPDGSVLAPNGQGSVLHQTLLDEVGDPEEAMRLYAMVHTPFFKRWFGDWEKAGIREFLDGPAVASMSGNEVPVKFDRMADLLDWVAKDWQSRFGGVARNPQLGEVRMDRTAARNSAGHGMSPTKQQAFHLAPEIIERGVVVGKLPKVENKPDAFLVAAPVSIGGHYYHGLVEVRRDANMQRLYVHEAILKKQKTPGGVQSAADSAEAVKPHSANPGAIATLLRSVLGINPETVSQVRDANGEPMVVWHHTDAEFTAFRPGKNGLIQFTSDPTLFSGKGSRRIAAFLSGPVKSNSTGKILSVTAPNQIKSASGNQGTFSGSGSILFADERPRSREALFNDVFAEEGYDAGEAILLPPEEQARIARENLKKRFGFKSIDIKGLNLRDAIDQMMDMRGALHDMAASMGLPTAAVSLNGRLTLDLSRKRGGTLGLYDPATMTMVSVGRNDVVGHEWAHGLDYFLLDNAETTERRRRGADRGATGARRDRNTVDGILGGVVDGAFNDLARALFQDDAATALRIAQLERKLARSKSDKAKQGYREEIERLKRGASRRRDAKGDFQKASEAMGGDYYRRPTEMLARAFEAYLASRMLADGMTTDTVVDPKRVGELAQLYPQGEQRDAVFAAIDKIMDGLAQTAFAGKPPAEAFRSANPVDPSKWPARTPGQRRATSLIQRQRDAFEAWWLGRKRAKDEPSGGHGILKSIDDMGSMTFHAMRDHIDWMGWSRYGKNEGLRAALRRVKDMVATTPGGMRYVMEGLEAAAERMHRRKTTRAMRALEDAGISPHLMTPEQSAELRGILLDGPKPSGDPRLKRAAAGLRRLMDDEWRTLHNLLGGEIGYARSGYLPRIYDRSRAFGDPEGFKSRAEEVYRLMIDRKIAEQRTANPDAETMTDEEAQEQAEAMAAAWWHNLVYGGDAGFNAGSGASAFLKGRTLPPEADAIMADFMVSDPIDAITGYLRNSSHKIARVERFGADDSILKGLYRELADAGMHPADLTTIQGMVDVASGRTESVKYPSVVKAMGNIHMVGTLSLLKNAVWSSLVEPLVIAARTGEASASWRVAWAAMSDIAKTRDSEQIAELAEYLGILADGSMDAVMANRFGADFLDSGRNSMVLHNFFERTGLSGLSGLTRHQQRTATRIGLEWLRRLAKKRRKGGNAQINADGLMAELGIPDPAAFSRWLEAHEDLDISSLDGDPMTEILGTALNRFVRESIQDPTAVDRPLLASSPTGRFVYGITAFSSSTFSNVAIGSWRRWMNTKGADEKAKAAFAAVANFGQLWLATVVLGALRSMIMDPDRWDDLEGEGFWGKAFSGKAMASGFSRAFPMGVADAFVLNSLFAVRYRRDIASGAVGPQLGYVLGGMQRIVSYYSAELYGTNSANNNTAERNAMRGIWELGMVPTMNYAASYLPGGPLAGPLLGAGMIFGSSHRAGRRFVDQLAGEKHAASSDKAMEMARRHRIPLAELMGFSGGDTFGQGDVERFLNPDLLAYDLSSRTVPQKGETPEDRANREKNHQKRIAKAREQARKKGLDRSELERALRRETRKRGRSTDTRSDSGALTDYGRRRRTLREVSGL